MTRAASRAVPLPPRKTAVGRADLLWLLHSLGESAAVEAARLAGYRFEAPQPDPPSIRCPQPRPQPNPPVDAESTRRPPLRATHFALIEHLSFPEPELAPAEPAPDGPLIEDLTGSGEAPPARTPLSPPRRLAVFLRGQLRPATPGRALDLPRLVGQLVRLRLPRQLPRAKQQRWSREAALVIDLSLPVYPLNDDLIELAELAHRLSGGSLCVLAHLAGGEWLLRQPGARPVWAEVGPAPLAAARHWLLAGDLGSLGDAARGAAWARRIRRHQAAGGEVNLLTSISPAAWRAGLPARTRLALWEHGRRPHLRRAVDSGAPTDADVARLLAALSLAVRVEPALLRDVRLALGLSMADELAVWNHADVDHCELGLQIRPERLTGHRQGVAVLTPEQRARVVGVVRQHHQGTSQLIRMEEAALAADLAGLGVDETADDWAAAVRTLQQAPGGQAARDLSAYLARTGRRAHPGLWRAVPALEEAYVLARRAALQAGAEVPAGVSARALARIAAEPGESGAARPLWILRRGSQLEVHTRAPGADCFVFASSPDCTGFELEAPGQPRRWLSVQDSPVTIGELQPGAGPWRLETPWARVTIAELPRPSWAIEWGCDRGTPYVLAPSPLGRPVRLDWLPPERGDIPLPVSPLEGPAMWPPGAKGFYAPSVMIDPNMELGVDLEYGLFVLVWFGNEVQRFRWIEPGEFLMGSPEGEVGRDNDEGPQHVVRLTEGYWLAETACSQALWSTVMGSNPSKFKDDPKNPVEQVRWDDVAAFLRKVKGLLPGLKAELPTEAEWEYACRAGKQAAFNWGNNTISAEQANYDARIGYAGGPTGEWRQKTVPVKSFAPNAWGLYQMHGNVWEWCADGPRTYDETPQQNPRGETGGAAEALRVVRGGSWFNDPRRLRAAFRLPRPRDGRLGGVGFRFLLRSTSPGAERPPEAVAAPEGLSMSIEPLTIGDKRSTYIDYVVKVIEGGQVGTGSVPWSRLRETIPRASNKPRKTKRGLKK